MSKGGPLRKGSSVVSGASLQPISAVRRTPAVLLHWLGCAVSRAGERSRRHCRDDRQQRQGGAPPRDCPLHLCHLLSHRVQRASEAPLTGPSRVANGRLTGALV